MSKKSSTFAPLFVGARVYMYTYAGEGENHDNMKHKDMMNQFSSRINRLMVALIGVMVLSISSVYAGTGYTHGRAFLRPGSPTGGGKVYVAASSSTPSDSQYKAVTSSTSPAFDVKNSSTQTYYFWAKANPGYIFTGWYTYEGALVSSGAARISKAVTQPQAGTSDAHAYADYYASFIKQIQMSFIEPTNGSFSINHNGSEVSPAYSSFTTEGKVVLTATPADGYKLRGWYTSTNGGKSKSYFAFGTSCEPNFTSNVTIGAEFVPDDGKASFWIKGTNKIYDNLTEANTAAAAASSKMIVVVSDGVVAEGSYTISSGVTLLIPFNETYSAMTKPNVVHYTSSGSAPALSIFRKLTLDPNATIEVEGTICVGGSQASVNGGNPSSFPCGPVGVLDMSRGGTITLKNKSILYAWGFVKGQDMDQGNNTSASGVGTITAKSGATVWEDFSVGEWRGGTASSTIYNNKSSWKFFPFQSYTIQNVEVPVSYENGSNLKCHWSIFGNGTTYNVDFPLIASSNSLFILKSGGSVKKWYDPTTDRVSYELGGSAEMNALTLSVMGESVTSADYNLPLPANMKLILASGNTLEVKKPMTMHAGSVIEIKSGATLKLNASGADIYMYDKDDWDMYCMYKYYYRTYKNLTLHYDRGTGQTKDILEDATIIVDGTLDLTGAGRLYATAHGANLCGNGGGTIKYGTLAGNKTMVQCKELSNNVSVNIRSANMHNDNDSYTKGIASTTFKNVNGRWFTNAKSTPKSNHTYDFTYIKSGDVYGTGGTNVTVSACYSKDKTGLVLQDKWANIKKDVCDNWWVGIDDSHLYNWSLNSAWHQYIKAGSISSGEDEGAVITDIYAGSDGKMLYKTDCDIVEAGTIDGNCLYPSDKALVNGSLITVAPNASPDHGYHKSDAATTYYLCFEGCVWHPATQNAENRYTVDGQVYIWYGDKWLAVQYDSGVGHYYSLSETNVKIYYEYVNHEWVLATPVAEVVTSAGTEQVYSLATAVSKAVAGGTNVTIRLLKNLSGTISYTGANNCGLDLNGYTLSSSSSSMITMNNASGTLIIKDQSAAGTGKIQAKNSRSDDFIYGLNVTNGHIIMNSGTVHIENTHASKGAIAVHVKDGKKFTMNGGKVEAVSKAESRGVNTLETTTSIVTINGGTIESSTSSTSVGASGIYSAGGTINMNGGTLTANADTAAYAINITNAKSTLTVNGGTIQAAATRINARGIGIGTTSSIAATTTINGGTIRATSNASYAYGVYSCGNTTVNGGKIYAEAATNYAYGAYCYVRNMTINSTDTIHANATSTYAYGIYSYGSSGKVWVNSGVFDVRAVSTAYGLYAYNSTDTINGGEFLVHASGSKKNAIGIVLRNNATPKCRVNGGKFKITSATSGYAFVNTNYDNNKDKLVLAGGYYNIAPRTSADGTSYVASGKSVKDVDCEKEAAMCSAGYVKKIAGNEYKVTWKNHKGDVVGTSMVESGKVPVWTGGEVNCSDATATRVQDGWCEGRWNNTDDPSGLGKWLFPTSLPAIGASDVTYFAHYKINFADVIVGGVTTPYYSAQTAWTEVQKHTRATIRLKTNLGTESSIGNMTQLVFNPTNANSIITMDLNGYSWTMGNHATASENKPTFLHVNPTQPGCKLIIIDNSELHNGYLMNSWARNGYDFRCVTVSSGELELQDGGLKVKNTASGKYSNAVVVEGNNAHFTMTGGTVYATDATSPRGVNVANGYGDISGGTVEVLSTASEAYALLCYDTVNVSGGATIKATGTTGSSYGLYCNGATSLLTVDSCTINVTAGANGKGMYATGAGTIVVDGNPTIGVSATGSNAHGAYVTGAGSEIIINSGTFTLAAASSTMGAHVVSSGIATINGGSFTLNGGTDRTFGAFAENGTVNMNGGNFTISQTSGGNKEGIRVYPNGTCNVTGGTYTLTGTSGNAMCMMGGTTSITGNPVFTAQYGLNVGATVVANGDLTATVTIDGGTYNTQSFTVQSLTTDRHDVYYDGSITGDVTIWDGHFKSNLAGYNVLGNTSPTSCLKIRGGWFSNNSSGKIATGSGNYVVSPSTVTTLTSSDQPEYDNGYRYRVNTKYSVTWKDGASTIKTEQYNRNEIPSFDDYDPSTAADTYVLTGWTPTPGPIQSDQIYTAVKTKYEAEVIEGDTTVGYKFENFMDAWNAAKNLPVAKVKLLSNVSMSTQLVLTPDSAAGSKPLTLDLNNHTLAYTGTTDRFLVVNKAGCVLKIVDSSVAKGGVLKYEGSYNGSIYTAVSYAGDVVLESGKILAKNTYAGKASRAMTPTGTTTFTMTGGTAEAHAATDARAIAQDGTPSVIVSGGKVIAKSYTISGDTVWGATSYGICMVHGSLSVSGNPILTSDAASAAIVVYVNNSDASFDIDGGTFISKAHNGSSSFCISTNTNSVGNTIHSGTFKAIGLNGGQIHAVHTLNSSVVDIKGGTFTSHANAGQSHCLFVQSGGTLNVSGGSFTAESDAPSNGNIEAVRIYTGGVVNISGGTFTSDGASNNIALRNLGGTATISGGTFTSGNYTIGVAEAGNIGSVGDVTVNINGGTFISDNNRNIYASSNDGTTSVAVTVNGGYFHSAGTNVVEKAGTATIVLNGGKYNETSGSNHKTNITSYKGSTTTVSDISETVAGKTYVYELLTKFNISWRGGSSYSKDEQIYSGIVPTNNECTSFIRNDSTFYFTGWSPTPTPVAGDATYQAVGDYYEAEVKIGSGAWTRYTDFLEAWDTVQVHANCSIRLLSSLTLSDKILYKPTEANARTVFDLNNCTLTAGGTANSFLEFNKEDAILTITDDSSEKGGKISISRTLASSSYALYVYNGELVMKGGHIYSENNQDDASWHPAIAIYVGSRAGAKLTMTDGTVEAEGKYCIYPVYTYGTTDISGGTVKATASGITSTGVGSATGVYVVNGTTRIRGTANIEVSSTSSATGAQAGAWISTDTTTVQRGTLNIEGGTFDVKSSVRAAYAIQTSATIKEYGGKYCKSHGTANVSGGTFSVKCSAATAEQVMALQCYDARVFDEATPHHMLAQESSVVNISGGTFTVDTRNNGAFVANAGNIDILRSWGTLNVTGGTFTIYQHTAPVGIGTYLGKTTVSGSPVFNVIAYENAKGILAAPWNHSTYCDADATKNLAEIEVNGGTFNVKATNSTVIGAQAAGSISAAGGTGVAGYAMSGKITINNGTFVCTAPSTIRCLLQYAPVSGDYGTATRTLIVKGGKYRAQIASVDANGTISGVINTTDGNNIDNGGSSNKIVDLAGGYFLNPHELNHNVADSCMVTEITSAAIDPEYNNGYRYRIDRDIKAIVTAGGVVRKYHDIKKALDYAKTVAAPTITIVQDGTFVGRWDLSNAIDGWQGVLDLNGHTVTGTGSVYHYAIIDVTKAGTKLTIRDSSVGQTGQLRHVETEDAHWGINVNNGAELKLESGTIYVKNNKTVSGYTTGICVNVNGGTFTQTGGKVEVHAPQKIQGVQVASASSGTASVSISGGEVEAASDNDPENLGDVVYALYVNRACSVTVNGTASISATADSASYGLCHNAASITTNIGGSASITASARKIAYAVTQGATATGTVTINGNAVISAETTDASAYGINNAAGSTTISGSVSIDAQASTSAYGISATGGSITVSGGTIETNGVSNGASIALYAQNATASVSGGTFTSSSDNAYTSNVSPIRSGVGSTVTIDGGTFNGVGFQAVSIRGGSTTINDGTFTSTTGIRAMDWADANGITGALTVNGGTFNCTGPVIHSSSMNNDSRNAHSEITVNGGKFKSTGSEIVKMTAAPAGATASTITIQGGYFNETDGTTFKTQIGDYVSNPYEVFTLEAGDPEIANGYSYEVCQHRVAKVESGGSRTYYTTIKAALDYAKTVADPTITLLANCTLTEGNYTINPGNWTGTLDLNNFTLTPTIDAGTGRAFTIGGSGTKFIVTDNSEDKGGKIYYKDNWSATNIIYFVVASGEMELAGGTLYVEDTNDSRAVIGFVVDGNPSQFTQSGGTFTVKSNGSAKGYYGKGTATFKGGAMNVESTAQAIGLYPHESTSKLNVSGSFALNVTSSTADSYGVLVKNSGATGTISGGKFKFNQNTIVSAQSSGSLTINGGYFCEKSGTTYRDQIDDYLGTGKAIMDLESADAEYIAGYRYLVTDDPVAKVKAGSEITYYTTLPAAFNYAKTQNNAEVTLLKDVVSTSTYTWSPSSAISNTFDLNGHSLSSTTGTVLGVGKAGATLTIKDTPGEGSISYSSAAGNWSPTVHVGNGKLILQGGTISRTANSDNAIGVQVYTTGDATPEFEMTGGKIQTSGGSSSYAVLTKSTGSNYATATISGGEVSATATGTYAFALTAAQKGNITVKGTNNPKISATDATTGTQVARNEGNGAIITIEGGFFKASRNSSPFNGAVSISGGYFNEYGSTTTYKTQINNRCVSPKHPIELTAAEQAALGAGGTDYKYKVVDAYTLTWNLAGGTVTTAGTQAPVDATGTPSGYVEKGASLTAPTVTKTGYTFSAWTPAVAGTMPAANTTYTATWTRDTYTISYDLADGSVASPNPTSYTVESGAIILNNPTKTGYTFAGWTGTGLASATMTVTIAAGSTGNRSYTATWTVNSYTIRFLNYDGSVLQSSSVNYGETPVYSGSTPTKPNDATYSYTFNTWSPAIAAVSGAQDYTATFNRTANIVASVTINSVTTYHTTISDAFTTANGASKAPTIKMLQDVSGISEKLSYSKALNCTLDLNGHTIAGTANQLLYVSCSGKTFTIINTGGSENGKISLEIGGTAATYCVYVNNGTLQLNAGTIYIHSTQTSKSAYGVGVKGSKAFTMNGGKVHAVTTVQPAFGVLSYGTTNINGGTIKVESASTGYGIDAPYGTTNIYAPAAFDVDGTTAYGARVGGYAAAGTYNGTLNIYGGTFDVEASTAKAFGVDVYSGTKTASEITYHNAGTANISGGTFTVHTSTTKQYAIGVQVGAALTDPVATPAANITGDCKFKVTAATSSYANATNTKAANTALVVEGGYYNVARGLTGGANGDYVAPGKPDYDYYCLPTTAADKASVGSDYNYKVTIGYVITYNKGANGTGTIAAGYKADGDDFTLSSSTFTRKGYTQTGWSTSDGGAKVYELGGTYSDNADLTVYPFWTAQNYTVTLNSQAATTPGTASIEVTYNSNTNLTATPAITLPTKTGYTFGGYYVGQGGSEKQVIAANGNVNASVSGITDASKNWIASTGGTIYAKWTQTVTLHDNNGGIHNGSLEVTYNSTYKSGTPPTREGYTAEGYYAEPACTNKVLTTAAVWVNYSGWVEDGKWVHDGESTLYTKWIEDTHTVTVAAGANGSASPASVTAGITTASGTITATPNTGYHFTNWTLVSGVTAASTYSTTSNPIRINATADDLTITANFAANTNTAYTVKHYKQNVTGDGYDLAETDNLTGTTGASVTPAVKSYTGFTAPSTQTVTILADGSRVVTYNYTRNSYTLTWALDGGSISVAGTTAGSVKYGASLTAPTVTKTGYTFSAWSPSVPATMPASNSTYTATWSEKSYTVTFYNGGHGTVKVNSSTVANGATASVNHFTTKTLAATASTGYTFAGWTKTGSVTLGNAANASTTITATATGGTVTATWTANTYNITYKDQGNVAFTGVHGDGYPTTHTYGTATALVSPTKTGYTFGGWYTTSACTGDAITSVGATAYSADFTLYAKWTINSYTITFNSNGGSAVASITQNYGTAVSAPSDPTKTGYTFAGWDPAVPSTMPASNTTCVAQWTPITYSVRFNKNDEGATGTMSNEAFTYDLEKALTANAFTKTGYNFDGWATSAGGDVVYTDGQSVSNLSSTQGAVVDLYAKWTAATYEVTLNQNGATTSGSTSVIMTYGAAEHSGITNPKKTGYSFKGWYTSAGGGTRIIKSDGTLGTKDGYVEDGVWVRTTATTLYAGWTQTIKLDKNGGSADGSAAVRYNSTTKLTVTAPTRDGYTVEGYYAEAGCTNKVLTDAGVLVNYSGYVSSGKWVHSGATTLYAKWTEDTHTVTVAAGANGSASPASVSGVGITTASGDITATPNTGYHFDNWTLPDGVTAASTYTASSNPIRINATADDKTITANFAPNTDTEYKVKHYQQNLDGSYPSTPTEIDNLTGTTGASVTPAVKSYTGFTAPSTQTETIAADGSLVIEYQYTRNSYTLTWALDGGSISVAGTTAGSVKYGAPLTAPTVTKTGYTFAGWSPDVPATMPAANSTYTATWEQADLGAWLDIVDVDNTNLKLIVNVTSWPVNGWPYSINGVPYAKDAREDDRTLKVTYSGAPGDDFPMLIQKTNGDVYSHHTYVIPQEVKSATTLSANETKNLYVKNGATLTVNANITAHNIYVAPDAKLTINSGKTLTADTIFLRTTKDDAAEMVLNGDLAGTTKLVYTRIIKDKDFHLFGLPLPCPVENVHLSDGVKPPYTTGWVLRSYDERRRAESGADGNNWVTLPSDETIAGGAGYEMFSASNYYREFYFPVSLPTTNKVAVAYTSDGAAGEKQAGWNALVSPFTHTYENAVVPEGLVVNWYEDGFYSQEVPSAIPPATVFAFQTTKTGDLWFDGSSIVTKMPRRASEEEVQIQWINLDIADANGLGDQTSIYSHPTRYEAAYQTGIDVAKQSLTAVRAILYSSHVYGDMAFAGVADSLLEQGVALTVYSPAAQELTFSMRDNEWTDRMAFVWLIDHQTGTRTDLLWSDYTFDATEGTTRGRFTIQGVFRAPQVATDIDNTDAAGREQRQVRKLIIHDKMYIEVNGQLFDATGKMVNK